MNRLSREALTGIIADAINVAPENVAISDDAVTTINAMVKEFARDNKTAFAVPADRIGEIVADDVYDTVWFTVIDSSSKVDSYDDVSGDMIVVSEDGDAIDRGQLRDIFAIWPVCYAHCWALRQYADMSAIEIGKMNIPMLRKSFDDSTNIPEDVKEAIRDCK